MKKIILVTQITLLFFSGYLFSQVRVASNGAAQMNVPINLLPGTDSMTPRLELVYDSTAGNGIMGKGWQLSGFPVVSRSNRRKTVRGDSTDDLTSTLFGDLVKQPNGKYRASLDPAVLIEAVGTCNNSPCGFRIQLKNGTRLFFGEEESAKVYFKGDTNAPISRWLLSKVENIRGIGYAIQYEKNGGTYWPLQIQYSTGSGISRYKIVRFEYETRSDIPGFHFQLVDRNIPLQKGIPRLKRIIHKTNVLCIAGVCAGGDYVRTWDFSYIQSPLTGASLLRQIDFLDSNSISSHPPISLQYAQSGNSFQWYQTKNLGIWNDSGNGTVTPDDWEALADYIVTDVNGDGRSDLFESSRTTSRLWDSSSNWNLTRQAFLHNQNGNWIVQDLNGDGKDDIFKHTHWENFQYILSNGTDYSGNLTNLQIESMGLHSGIVWLENGNLTGPECTIETISGTAYAICPDLKAEIVPAFVDIDGDFRRDIGFMYNSKVLTDAIDDIQYGPLDYERAEHMNPSLQEADLASMDHSSHIDLVKQVMRDNNAAVLGLPKDDCPHFVPIFGQRATRNNPRYEALQNMVPGHGSFCIGDSKSNWISLDVNGDGKTDFVKIAGRTANGQWPDGLPYFYENAVIFFTETSGSITSSIAAPTNFGPAREENDAFYKLLPADINGDGLGDIIKIYSRNSRKYYEAYLSNGQNFEKISAGELANANTDSTTFEDVIVLDVNGDGRSDLIELSKADPVPNQPGEYGSLQIRIFTSGGIAFQEYRLQTLSIRQDFINRTGANPLYVYKYKIRWADFDADGAPDIGVLLFDAVSDKVYISEYRLRGASTLLTEIRNGYGGRQTLIYEPKSSFIDAVRPAESNYADTAATGVLANKIPQWLVKYKIQYDGEGNSYTMQYNYHNDKIVLGIDGEGYRHVRKLGFESVDEINVNSGEKISNFYYQSEYLIGQLSSENHFAGNGSLMSQIFYSRNAVEVLPGVYSLQLTEKTEKTYNLGTPEFTNSTSYTYDSYGNMLTETLIRNGGTPVLTEFTYDNLASGVWLIGRLKEKKITASGKIFRHEKYLYDTCTFGRICEKRAYLDKPLPKWISTTYEYDAYGNLVKETGPSGQIVQYEYDSVYHNKKTKVVNPKGYSVSYEYDSVWEAKTKETDDQTGASRQWEYDSAGRRSKEKEIGHSDYNIIYGSVYNAANMAGNPNFHFVHRKIGGIWQKRIKFFDGMNRVYRELDTDEASGLSFESETEYDSSGRISRKSARHLSSEPALFTSFEYDSAGRLLKKTFPDGNTKTYIYTAGSVAVIDSLGGSLLKNFNAAGKVANIKENGKQVIYSYDEFDRIIEVKDAVAARTFIEYDTLGRKVSMTEPNSGLWQYRYDDAGNMIRQTDPRGREIVFAYDELNRLVSKDYGNDGIDIRYFYDESSSLNSKDRLSRVTDESGETTFHYDERGNLISWIKSIDGYVFLFRASYDENNKLTELIYPDGEKIKNYYDYFAERIKEIRLFNSASTEGSVVVRYDVDYAAHEVRRETGNGVVSAIGYDPFGFRPTSLKTVLPDSSVAQDLAYSYDAVGNLTGIDDRLEPAKSQSFAFDSFYRLTYANGVYGSRTYEYGNGGNLVKKDGVTYLYADFNRKQRVSLDSHGGSYAYDNNGNLTSRAGRVLEYDAEDRLVAVRENGVEKFSFLYDFTGARVKKSRQDGTVVYTMGKYYEVSVDSAGNELHTKYIYGVENDRVAQITRANVTLAGLRERSHFYATLYTSNLRSYYAGFMLLLKPYYSGFAGRPEAGLLVIFFLFAGGYFIARYRGESSGHPPGFSIALNVILLTFVFQLLTLSCSGSQSPREPSVDNPYNPPVSDDGGSAWSNLPEDPPPDTPQANAPQGSWNDTAKNGMPVLGIYFYHPNHLGSTALLTNASGKIIARFDYEPYGSVYRPSSSGFDIARYKYTGQEEDYESGLYYYNARYYDPGFGRFIGMDSIVPGQFDSQAYNRYMYVRGNPVNYTDPSGHWLLAGFFVVLMAAVFGCLVNMAFSANSSGPVNYGAACANGALSAGFATLGGLTAGVPGAAIAGGFGSALGSAMEDRMNEKKVDVGKLTIAALLGTLSGAASFYAGKQISKQAMKSFGDILSRTYAEAFGEVFAGLTIGVVTNFAGMGVRLSNIDEEIDHEFYSDDKDSSCNNPPYDLCISNMWRNP